MLKGDWSFETGLELVREIERQLAPRGWHAALAGGVLHRGSSIHDLDVIIYPHCRTARQERLPDTGAARQGLRKAGLKYYMGAQEIKSIWRRKGSLDCKHVEIWTYGGSRVDVIFLS